MRTLTFVLLLAAVACANKTSPPARESNAAPAQGSEASAGGSPAAGTGGTASTGSGGTAGAGATCANDGDCRLFSDYCTGCDCRALARKDSDPTCAGPGVRCLVDPCQRKKAACQKGRCVVAGDDYDPCAGKKCGDSCKVCPPTDATCMETMEVKQCNADGKCSPAPPGCGSK
jgi:hypothetical protein